MSFQHVDSTNVADRHWCHAEKAKPPPMLKVDLANDAESDASTTASPRRLHNRLIDFDTDSSVAGSRSSSPCKSSPSVWCSSPSKHAERTPMTVSSLSQLDHHPSLADNSAGYWTPGLPGLADGAQQSLQNSGTTHLCTDTAPMPKRLCKPPRQLAMRIQSRSQVQAQKQAQIAQQPPQAETSAIDDLTASLAALLQLQSSAGCQQATPVCAPSGASLQGCQQVECREEQKIRPVPESWTGLGLKSASKSALEPKASIPTSQNWGRREDVAADAAQESGWMGCSVNDFKVLKTVGTGFMGSVRVVKLKHGADRTPFALKIMKKSKVIQHKQVEHVMAERQVLSSIRHPFIVKLVTSFQDDARLFMLMEFVNGGELFSVIKKTGRLYPDPAKFYASEIILAIAYLHSLDVCYRDLKPENVLIDSKGHTKITDFGFAKVVKHRTWTLCGTPEYLAPEIITTKGHGKAVDWWAIGVLIFEMLTGRAPFTGQSSSSIYRKVLTEDVEYPSYFGADATDLVGRLLIRDQAHRLGSLSGGAEDVKGHAWFRVVNWDMMLRRKYTPPFVPGVKSASDTSMFDKYPEESIEADAGAVSAQEQELFHGYSCS